MKLYVVPDPSLRFTGVMSVDGRFTPGFSFVIRLSFHLAIFPR